MQTHPPREPATSDAARKPAVQARMRDNGVIPSQLGAEEFTRFAAQEGEKWLAVMKQANIQPN